MLSRLRPGIKFLWIFTLLSCFGGCVQIQSAPSKELLKNSETLGVTSEVSLLVAQDELRCERSPEIFCSLAEAIKEAKKFSGLVTIKLMPNSVHELVAIDHQSEAGNGLPEISGDVIVIGNGAIIQRSDASGTPLFRLLHIAKTGNVTINNIVLRNGRTGTGFDGAGIWNLGRLQLIDSIVERNISGDDGGGIRNDGFLKVSRTIIRNNRSLWKSGVGGGIQNMVQFGVGELVIQDSAIIENESLGPGGGLWSRGTSSISDTTFSKNFSGHRGGAIQNYGELTIQSSTITENTADVYSGGIHTFVPITLSNSILAGNRSQFSPDCSGVILSGGHNLIGKTYNCEFDQSDDTDYLGILPKLAPLHYALGSIPFHPSTNSSQSFGYGKHSLCETSYIRQKRESGKRFKGRCDIGARIYP